MGKKGKKDKRRDNNSIKLQLNVSVSVNVYRFNKAHVYVSEISSQTLPQKNFETGKSKIQWKYDTSKILHVQVLGNVGLNLFLV